MTTINAVSEMSATCGTPTDGALVLATLSGRKEAFDELVSRYQSRTVATAYRYLGNLQDALEVSQEAFLKAFTSLFKLQQVDAFGAWLMRIVSNLSLNFRRSRKTRSTIPLDDLLPSTPLCDPCRQIQSAEILPLLDDALTHLPKRQRAALELFALEQTPQKEVAQTLGCSVEAVKWHVFEGRRKLREILEECL